MATRHDPERWTCSDERAALIWRTIDRYGLRGDGLRGDGTEDHRVGYSVLVLPSEIVDVVALPPSGAEWYARTASDLLGHGSRVHLLDFHVGRMDGSACGTPKDTIRQRIEVIGEGRWMHQSLIGSLLHARRLAYTAATRGHRWSGRQSDLPIHLRHAGEE